MIGKQPNFFQLCRGRGDGFANIGKREKFGLLTGSVWLKGIFT
jgi:hypothetical protein